MSSDPTIRKDSSGLLLVSEGQGAGIQQDESYDETLALEVAQALDRHYPGHPWIVTFQARGLFLRHIDIANAVTFKTGKNGFGSLLPQHRMESRKQVIASAVRFAGELLEAFGMPRGRWDPAQPARCPDWKRGQTGGFH